MHAWIGAVIHVPIDCPPPKENKPCIYIIVPFIAVLVPPPSEVQALCSVVVWESPDALHCNNLIGFDVRLFGSPQLQQNLTRRVRSNRTYYVISDEDNLANSYETYVQVLLTYSNPNIIYIQYHGINYYRSVLCLQMLQENGVRGFPLVRQLCCLEYMMNHHF